MRVTPHTYVIWWPKSEPHGHLLYAGDPSGSFEGNAEDIALELVEALERCSPQRHGGHGKAHSTTDLMDAFTTAIQQLQTTDYEKEWEELQTNIRLYEMWGGPVPRAVLFPDELNPREWNILVPDRETGMPRVYEVKNREIARTLPPPQPGKDARKGRFGWEAIPPDPSKLPGKGLIVRKDYKG